jgi:hypothetical protein
MNHPIVQLFHLSTKLGHYFNGPWVALEDLEKRAKTI